MDTVIHVAGTIALVWLFLLVPIIIAFLRGNAHTGVICILSLLLGWTGIGWLFLLVWALFPDFFSTVRRAFERQHFL